VSQNLPNLEVVKPSPYIIILMDRCVQWAYKVRGFFRDSNVVEENLKNDDEMEVVNNSDNPATHSSLVVSQIANSIMMTSFGHEEALFFIPTAVQ